MKTATTLEIEALRCVEYLTETNEGTFGAHDCRRAVGSGDPAFGTYRVYESVSGTVRHTGCGKDRAPGYARRLNRDALAADRRRLAELLRS